MFFFKFDGLTSGPWSAQVSLAMKSDLYVNHSLDTGSSIDDWINDVIDVIGSFIDELVVIYF